MRHRQSNHNGLKIDRQQITCCVDISARVPCPGRSVVCMCVTRPHMFRIERAMADDRFGSVKLPRSAVAAAVCQPYLINLSTGVRENEGCLVRSEQGRLGGEQKRWHIGRLRNKPG